MLSLKLKMCLVSWFGNSEAMACSTKRMERMMPLYLSDLFLELTWLVSSEDLLIERASEVKKGGVTPLLFLLAISLLA